jgi:hypothetical protein
MGLGITWYRGCSPAPDADPDDWENVARASVVPEFASCADGIEHGGLFTFEKSGGFRAGSYSGYNDWREELAKLAGYPALEDAGGEHRKPHSSAAWVGAVAEDAPFLPLVDFSDCEGTIGPQTSARLAKDFAAHQTKADRIGGYFAEKYTQWRNAFEQAQHGGFVDFH